MADPPNPTAPCGVDEPLGDQSRHVVPPPEVGPVTGPEAVDRAVRRRFYGGVWRKPPFGTHADARRFKQQLKIYELLHEVPQALLVGILGEDAVRDVPSVAERTSLIASTIAAKAGPEGGNAHTALRAWRLLQAAAKAMARTDFGLPCGRAMVAVIVQRENRRAAAAATAERSGATVGGTVREGFEWLEAVLKLPIEAKADVVMAAAEPPPAPMGARRAVRQSASAPPCIQLHLEVLAASAEWSVARAQARELLTKSIVQNVRLNDALNAQTWADASDAAVILGRTTTRSKDGMALDLFAPAEGWLAPFEWWPEHAAEMQGRGGAWPDFSASGPRVARARELKAGVLPRAKALPLLRALCELEPLSMGAAEFDSLGITMHSFHGSGPDLVRFLGSSTGLSEAFSEIDARRIGHWLRDRSAPEETVTRVGRHVAGATNQRGEMGFRYTQGVGRIGERREQLVLRARLVHVVRRALVRFGPSWLALPRDNSAWETLFPARVGDA